MSTRDAATTPAATSQWDFASYIDAAANSENAHSTPFDKGAPAVARPPFVDHLTQAQQARVVGFFPGLGSRSAFQDLGSALLESGAPEVTRIYREAAFALDVPGRPHRVLTEAANLPAGRLARQGFIGAALLVHSLALEAHLREAAARRGTPLIFRAYTGESFGMLTAAVAGGALSVGDGVAIAHAFTPMSLTAAEGVDRDEPLSRLMAAHLPVRQPLVPEPFHVVGLSGRPDLLAVALERLGRNFRREDVEIHKRYSPMQVNLYVRGERKADFDWVIGQLPGVEAAELKAPTTFLAHASRMRALRAGLESFMHTHGIAFTKPHTAIIANHGGDQHLLTTAAEVREAVLSIADRVMDSRRTVASIERLHPDLVLELGPGGKSVQLLEDNHVTTPVAAYTGTETAELLDAFDTAGALVRELRRLHPAGDDLGVRHYDLLRTTFRSFAESELCERYTRRLIGRLSARELLRDRPGGSTAYHRFLEAFQHTVVHRAHVEPARGELVLQARTKKRLTGADDELGRAYTELRIVDGSGAFSAREVAAARPEVLVAHFDRMPDADPESLRRQTDQLTETQPLAALVHERLMERLTDPAEGEAEAADRIACQYAVFQLLRLYRPAVLQQSDTYLIGGDPLGWLVALAASNAVTPPDVVELYAAVLRGSGTRFALERLMGAMRDAELPVIAPDGVPLQSKKDLAAAARAIFLEGALDEPIRTVHLSGDAEVIALGSRLDPDDVRGGRYRVEIVNLSDPQEVWQRGLNPALDAAEDRAAGALTAEQGLVLRQAQHRRILSSTINAYVHAGERITGFGRGGSESMTIFMTKPGETDVTVRKVLSEALVTASWDPAGEGVMLPPFAKARKQAEFLQALPGPVLRRFPEVYAVTERSIPALSGGSCAEVIYEMSYVPGEEVSRYIERRVPDPAVVARIYEHLVRTLHRDVHSFGRVPSPGGTLEASYFKKIEDRLALSAKTAPRTFGPDLLGPERIWIDGRPYRNAGALLAWFRAHPEHQARLEPRYHALVMGDTNTENVKLTDTAALEAAQRLIETGAPAHRIDAALAAATDASLGIRFLDPRAIGFESSGADTRDDPMYDNKPWHNSIGHYDEIHFEHFKLAVDTGPGREPRVDVSFTPGNPFERAYRVRDVAVTGAPVTPERPQGMEDHFASVMTAALGLDDPDSPFLADDPDWLVRFVFMMGTHFTAMPPFHFQAELDGTLTDTPLVQRRPVAIYCEGVKWLNWAVEMLEGTRTEFLGIAVPR